MFTQALHTYTDIAVNIMRLLILQGCNKMNLGYARLRELLVTMTILY